MLKPYPFVLALVLISMICGGSINAAEKKAAENASPAPAPCYDWILKEKMRGGYLGAGHHAEETVAKCKAAGLNVMLPKFNDLSSPLKGKNFTLLQEWGTATNRAGLHFFPVINFRGGGAEKLVNDRREVTPQGQRMLKTPCPLDEAFWKAYIHDRVVDLAEHSKELHIDGVMIDPEMYGSDHSIFRTPCYCDDCLRNFLQATGKPIPNPLPEPAARLQWLKDQKLSQAFEEHFTNRVRDYCVKIEQAAHASNPNLVLGVLLLDYDLAFMHGMAKGLGVEKYPVLALSETTYSNGLTEYIESKQKQFNNMPAHVLLIPGLWINQFPSENFAEQCYGCAQHSVGYWLFTLQSLVGDSKKMPDYAKLDESADLYWDAIRLADSELDKLVASNGTYESTLKVRPFNPFISPIEFVNVNPKSLTPVDEEKPLSLGEEALSRLRGFNPLYIQVRANEPVEVNVSNQPLGKYLPGTRYAVFDAEGNLLTEGKMKLGESAVAKWTPKQDGIQVLIATSKANGYSFQVLTKQPAGFRVSEKNPLYIISRLGRLYFFVPKGVDKVSLFVRAGGQAPGRGGKLAVMGPDGKTAAHLEGDLGVWTELPLEIPEAMQGRVWALTAKDVTNDLHIYLSSKNNTFCLGTDPTRLLKAE